MAIDDVVNPPQALSPQEKKEEPKKISTLESVVGEFRDLFNLGVGIAAPAAGYALTGNLGVPATSIAYIAATKGKKDSKIIRNESLSGSIFGTFAHYTLLPLNYIGSAIRKVAYMIPWVFGANAFYMAEDHLIKEKSPKGLYKKFKENYFKVIKKAFMLPAPLNILSALFIPQQYLVAAAAVTGYLFRRFVAGGKGEEYEDKRAYPIAALSVTGKLVKNPIKGMFDAAHAIGSSISDLYKKAPKPATPQTPPAPAMQPA